MKKPRPTNYRRGIFPYVLLLILLMMTTYNGNAALRTDPGITREIRFEGVKVNSFEISTIGKVVFKTGAETKIEVEADASSLPDIVTSCKSGKLKVYTRAATQSLSSTVYITLKESVKCKLHAISTVESQGVLQLESLVIKAKAVGEVILSVNCNYLEIQGEAIGKVYFSGTATESELCGKAMDTFDASHLISKNVKVAMSAVARILVYATDHLDISVKAAAAVFVGGNATIDKSSSGPELVIQKI